MLHFAVYAQNFMIVAAEANRGGLDRIVERGQVVCVRGERSFQRFDAEALKTAKEQAKQITSIDSLAPACRIACQAYFTSVLSFRLDDPPAGRSHRLRTIKITRSEFEHAYDDSIRTVIDLRGANAPLSYANRRFRGARIEEADLWIAVSDQSQAQPPKFDVGPLNENEYLGKRWGACSCSLRSM